MLYSKSGKIIKIDSTKVTLTMEAIENIKISIAKDIAIIEIINNISILSDANSSVNTLKSNIALGADVKNGTKKPMPKKNHLQTNITVFTVTLLIFISYIRYYYQIAWILIFANPFLGLIIGTLIPISIPTLLVNSFVNIFLGEEKNKQFYRKKTIILFRFFVIGVLLLMFVRIIGSIESANAQLIQVMTEIVYTSIPFIIAAGILTIFNFLKIGFQP